MRLTDRSYPYPVVGNRDDVVGVAFQSTLEMTSDKQMVYLDATVRCSSRTINELIAAGDACFTLHVECGNTLFRKAFEFTSPKHRIQISTDSLHDAVEVNVFARAKRPLSAYRVENSHPDYGTHSFEIERGDVLAIGEGHIFYVESPFDSLSPVGSIMHITGSTQNGDCPMQVDYSGDKILIILSQNDFTDYKRLKLVDGLSGALTTSIVLPVLVDALHMIRKPEDSDDHRWMRCLLKKIELLGLKADNDPLETAQKMLELPLKRVFASAGKLQEDDS